MSLPEKDEIIERGKAIADFGLVSISHSKEIDERTKAAISLGITCGVTAALEMLQPTLEAGVQALEEADK